METTRRGKIARLPVEIREQLNRCLEDGEEGNGLVDWLNSLPEVQKIMAEEFNGEPICQQNFSRWVQGGYREWLFREHLVREATDASGGAGEIEDAVGTGLAADLATLLTAKYAAWLNKWKEKPDSEAMNELRLLHVACQDILGLQRGAQQVAKAEFEMEQFEKKAMEGKRNQAELAQLWKAFYPNDPMPIPLAADAAGMDIKSAKKFPKK